MTKEIEIQERPSIRRRVYNGLLGAVFAISNTIALVSIMIIASTLFRLEIPRLFYWIGVALLHIITYPRFSSARPRTKYLLMLISAAVMITAVVVAISVT